MKGPHDVIKAPLISEKGTLLTENANQVLFKVQPDANKIEVKQAVETIFKVKVVQVRMARYLGKMRRIGRSMGRRTDWKKAYVTLKEGDKIDFFGGA
ncbi:MAG TPA: 50S ribosomal protein L23 [Candidatus Binatia bacterium]|jgi:large subunit ribosomal protein L23